MFLVNIWNSLPTHIANSSSVNSFKNKLDIFWNNQEVYYNFRCDATGTRNRSVSQNWLDIYCIEVCYKEVDIEGFMPASSIPILYDTIQYN